MIFSEYPYTNFHELNLDWIIKTVKELTGTVDDFVAFNKITFLGTWTGTAYPAWAVVDDGSGNGYLSLQPVPAGVSLSDTTYWTQVASYSTIYSAFNSRISALENGTINGFALSSMPFAIGANAIPYDGTLSGLSSTRVQSAIDEVVSDLNAASALSYQTFTDNGLTIKVAKIGRITMMKIESGTTGSDVAANTPIITLPAGYLPWYIAPEVWDSVGQRRMILNLDGTLRCETAVPTGTYIRCYTSFICQ